MKKFPWRFWHSFPTISTKAQRTSTVPWNFSIFTEAKTSKIRKKKYNHQSSSETPCYCLHIPLHTHRGWIHILFTLETPNPDMINRNLSAILHQDVKMIIFINEFEHSWLLVGRSSCNQWNTKNSTANTKQTENRNPIETNTNKNEM